MWWFKKRTPKNPPPLASVIVHPQALLNASPTTLSEDKDDEDRA